MTAEQELELIRQRGIARSPTRGDRFRRLAAKYATALVSAAVLGIGSFLIAYIRGMWSLPNRMDRVEAQGKMNGAAIDTLRQATTGVVAVLCLKLSDEEFENAKTLCGEAFRLNRVLTRDRNPGVHQ